MTVRSRSTNWLAVLLALSLLTIAPLAAASPTYRMSLDIQARAGTYDGTLSVLYRNPAPVELGEVFLRLYPNDASLFGSASLDVAAASVGELPVEPALFADDTVLLIPLPTPIAPGEEVEIHLTFRGRAADARDRFATASEYGLLTRSRDVLTLIGFYPILAPYTGEGWAIDPPAAVGDPLFADAATYEVSLLIDADAAVIPVSDGSSLGADGRVQLTYSRQDLRDFSLVVVDSAGAPLERLADGIVLRSWFSAAHAEAGRIALDRGAAAVDIYTTLFGSLPYPAIDIVEAPLQRAAGVECSGLFLVASASAAAPRDPFFDIIISHEMAHQWFYALLGNDPTEEPWLDEALATYASNVFLALAMSGDVAQAERAAWATTYSRARQAHPDLRVTSPVGEFPDSQTYASFVYSGGAFELDAIRRQVGDDAFFAALADYTASHRGEITTGDDLCASLRHAYGGWVESALCGGEPSPMP